MSDRVAAGLARVADRVTDDWGIPVEEVSGWEDRGHDGLDPHGFVRHHTAGSQSGGRYASLRVVTFGRSDLRNALCNVYVPRGPGAEVWLVAAGLAWHAGRGDWLDLEGNDDVLGGEYENDGRGEPWHPDALRAQLAIEVECAREFAFPARFGCEHYEWTPRKIDRARIHGQGWRDDVAVALAGHGRPAFTEEEDDMTPEQARKLDQVHAAVARLDDPSFVAEVAERAADKVFERLQPSGGEAIGSEVDRLRRDMRRVVGKVDPGQKPAS